MKAAFHLYIYLCVSYKELLFPQALSCQFPLKELRCHKSISSAAGTLSAGDALWAARTQLHPEHPIPTLPGPHSCQELCLAPSTALGVTSALPLRSAGKARDPLFVISIYRHHNSVKKKKI